MSISFVFHNQDSLLLTIVDHLLHLFTKLILICQGMYDENIFIQNCNSY